ncbi:hypothetical protein KEM55_000760 [Ascosphaera atra]|nr:hypothetical protein KEM55_000760 [Ascosphaera atra]
MPYPITSSPVAAGAGAGAGGAMGSPMDLDMSMGMSFPPTPPLYSHQPHFPQQRNKRLTPTQQAQISAAQARIFNLPQHGAAHQHHHQQSPPTSAGSMTSGSSSRSQSQQHEPNTMLKSPRKRLSTEDHQAPLPPSQPPMFFNHSSMNPNLLQQTHTQSAPMPIPSNTANEQWQSATAATPLTPMSALSVSPANITSNPLASPSEPLMNAGMPPNLDDCVDFIDSFDAFNAFSPSSSYSGMPDWKEDDDLKLFLNPNPGVL